MPKATCYVVRDGRLLVFRHRDHPLAGVQVPAGTLHPDEPPAAGALREAEEETGRSGFRILRALHLAEEGNGDFWFDFSWVPLTPDLVLAADQHAYLGRLRPVECWPSPGSLP